MNDLLANIIDWANDNSGFLGLLLFVTTILIGWVAGLFKYLRKKPKFKIRVIDNASFGCVFDLNRTHEGYPVNKTAFALYLEITNIGNAASSIGKITLGYLLSDLRPKWRTSRNWLNETSSKSDFKVEFNDSDLVKVFPFLKQQNATFPNRTDTFLAVGKTVNGIVYFEQTESYGSWMPRYNKDLTTTNLVIKIKDAFGKIHKKRYTMKLVEPDYTFGFSPYFGQTEKEYFNPNNDFEQK